MTKLAAGPGFTAKAALRPVFSPEALAVSCLLVPAESIRKSLNTAVPLPAAVPRSRVVVPWSGPVPVLKLTITGRLAGRPAVVTLPNWSWVWITG